ncbi:MAG: chemotaxis protein CheR [Gammaproteobacteria bacterium]|nr:MAG: chemotaxis protein CheR [Gammaproteobacteria bacterium]PIE36855.1 MAG: chemotaxis protein CheR [Gammaproteobacteria bacterium]
MAAQAARKFGEGEVQDFAFTDRNFETLREIVRDKTGISLSDFKRTLVYGRLARRLRKLELTSFDDYCTFLEENPETELEHFTNAITTNLTAFFRENHHFEFLANELLPELVDTRRQRRLRIWSAGCSTGEEPYSLAMTLRESIPHIDNLDVRILATDIDSSVLAVAEAGVYDDARVAGLPAARLKRWFQRGSGRNHGKVRVREELRRLISFRRLNLMDPWPMRGSFDLIMCRNVVIYFDKQTQSSLFERFANQSPPDGHLIIGHSENLHSLSDRYSLIGKTVYRKQA